MEEQQRCFLRWAIVGREMITNFSLSMFGCVLAILGAVLITDVCSMLFNNDVALIVSLLLSFTWGYFVFPLVEVLWSYFKGDPRNINI